MQAQNFFAGGTAYNASKFGLTGFTQALMLDLRQDDIKVTTIMPGSVNTYFGDKTPDDSKAWPNTTGGLRSNDCRFTKNASSHTAK